MLPARCWLAVLSAAAFTGCVATPESYPVPEQRLPFRPQALISSEFVGAGDPHASQFFVRDIHASDSGLWRWTAAEPELQFILKSTQNRRLIYEFIVNETTFRDTGPVAITFLVNGNIVARERYDTPGDKRLEITVPDVWLRAGEPVRVTARIENTWRSPNGDVLGVLLKRAGFVP